MLKHCFWPKRWSTEELSSHSVAICLSSGSRVWLWARVHAAQQALWIIHRGGNSRAQHKHGVSPWTDKRWALWRPWSLARSSAFLSQIPTQPRQPLCCQQHHCRSPSCVSLGTSMACHMCTTSSALMIISCSNRLPARWKAHMIWLAAVYSPYQ